MRFSHLVIILAAWSLICRNLGSAFSSEQQLPSAAEDPGGGAVGDSAKLKYALLEAEEGVPFAQFNAGSIYANGSDGAQDFVQAYKWLSLSIAGSVDKKVPVFRQAMQLRDSVAKKMAPEQIEEAERLAKEWEENYIQKLESGSTRNLWGVIPPVPVAQPLPSFTDEARAARITGSVLIQCTIRKDGSVDSLKLIRGLGYGLDEAAITIMAKEWRFKPGTFRGKPMDVQANVEVTFKRK